MMLNPEHLASVAAPWKATLSDAEHQLIAYVLGFAALALLAGLIRAIITRGEVGARYRAATVARLGVMGVASISYVAIIVAFVAGYDYTADGWVPNQWAVDTFALRYMEWSLTVPLLCVELLAVTTLAGAIADRTRLLAMGGALAMIVTGYLGAIVIDGGENPAQILIWFGISSVFWIATTVLLARAVRSSLPGLTAEAGRWLTSGTIVLLGGWFIYPVVSLIQVLAEGGEWTATMQICFTIADVAVKVGFAGIIHRVAKLRTAEDVRAGDDMHLEAIWISSVKRSDAGLPRVVYLAEGAIIHQARLEPPAHMAEAQEAEVRPLDTSPPGEDY